MGFKKIVLYRIVCVWKVRIGTVCFAVCNAYVAALWLISFCWSVQKKRLIRDKTRNYKRCLKDAAFEHIGTRAAKRCNGVYQSVRAYIPECLACHLTRSNGSDWPWLVFTHIASLPFFMGVNEIVNDRLSPESKWFANDFFWTFWLVFFLLVNAKKHWNSQLQKCLVALK